MSDDNSYVTQFEDYLESRNMKDEFERADGKGKSAIANKYVREEIPFDEKPAVVKALNDKYENAGPFLNNKRLEEGNTGRICSPDRIYKPEEIIIYLLKRLQSGEDESKKFIRSELAAELGLSPQSFDKYMQKFGNEKGIDIFGSKIKAELRHGKNTYDHTVHPVFLALNLTEVHFLTALLPELVKKNKSYEKIALGIAGDVYRQLSDYAKEKMDHFIPKETRNEQLKGIQASGYRKEKDDLPFFRKSSIPCSIELNHDVIVSGIIRFDEAKGLWQITEEGTGTVITFNEEEVTDGPKRYKNKKI